MSCRCIHHIFHVSLLAILKVIALDSIMFSNFLLFFTGMLAAEATFGVLHEGSNMETYWDALQKSWIWEELYRARNYRPVSNN